MKKLLFVILVLSIVLSACLPAFSQQQPVANNNNEQATQVDIQGTAAVMAATMAAQTIEALPTPTLIPPSKVVAVSPTPTIVKTDDPNIMLTATILTSSVTGTAKTETASVTPATATQTPTPGSGIVTATPTLHVRFYGTLPPKLPYGFVSLSNKSKAEAYISLQCTTKDGYTTILEYPVKGPFEVQAPSGHYTYVAWVGGNKMTGSFILGTRQDLSITLYKDKIVFK